VTKIDTFVLAEHPAAAAVPEAAAGARYVVLARSLHTGQQVLYACRFLIMSAGVQRMAHIRGAGLHLASTYESMSTDLSLYVNKRVLIVGRGNAAMEVSHHLQEVAMQIHVLGPQRRLKLAWESHYPGDVRQVRPCWRPIIHLRPTRPLPSPRCTTASWSHTSLR